MAELNIEQNKRELARWYVLLTLWHGGSVGAAETLVLYTIQSVPMQITSAELRAAMQYLSDLEMLKIEESRQGWHARLTPNGVDVVEYNVFVTRGIARPAKYWAG
jgi:hypothetical protein